MLTTACLLLSSALSSGQHSPIASKGCGSPLPSGFSLGNKVTRTVKTEGMDRTYYIYLPKSYSSSEALPSIFYFHGQFGQPSQGDGLMALANSKGFALVELQGASDKGSGRGNCGTGWNTGSSQNMTLSAETCTSAAYYWSCCYASCEAQGKCKGDGESADCLWSTCLNDDVFAEDVLADLSDVLCFDLDAVFASGQSNGGIIAHYLAAQNPNQWKGVMPVFGSPLRGFLDVSFALKGTSFLQLHGRTDKIIPYAGGLSNQGWYYESMDDVAFAWGEVNGCDEDSRALTTPYDGIKNLACVEHPNCINGVRVIRCLFDGGHSTPSTYNDLAYWFLETTLDGSVSTHVDLNVSASRREGREGVVAL